MTPPVGRKKRVVNMMSLLFFRYSTAQTTGPILIKFEMWVYFGHIKRCFAHFLKIIQNVRAAVINITLIIFISK